MSQNRAFIAELQMEAASTRKMLERVPTDKNDWKPHEKSMKLGRLSSHIAELPGWIAMVVTTDELDLSKMDYKPTIATSTEELTALHDTHVNKAIAALESTPDEDFEKMWTLRRGEDVIFAMPKKVVLRSMAYSHMIHHRGQLSVYLRLSGIPIPGMYGPSYDEMPVPADVVAEAMAN